MSRQSHFSKRIFLFILFIALIPFTGPAYGQDPSIDVSKIGKDKKVVESVLKVDQYPLDIALAPDNKTFYISHHFSGKISEIRDNQVVRSNYIGPNLTGIAVTRDGSKIYVGVASENMLAIVDPKTLTLIRKIPVGQWPIGVRLSPDDRFVAVACYTSNDLHIVSTSTDEVKSIAIGTNPFYLAISPTSTRVYVSNYGSGSLSVVEVELEKGNLSKKDIYLTLLKTIPVGSNPVGVGISPDGKVIYVANYTGASVTAVSGESLTPMKTYTVGQNPYFIAVAPDSSYIIVSNYSSPYLDIIYSDGKRTRVELQNSSVNVFISPDGRKIVLSNYNLHTVSIIE